jgi:hypothetical protein
MLREPIHDYMLREHGIAREEWEVRLLRSCWQFLKELQSRQGFRGHRYESWDELEEKDPITASELGGQAERVLAASYGWTTYVSKKE